MSRHVGRTIAILLLVALTAGGARAQSAPPKPPPSGPTTSPQMTALIEQLLDLFPIVEGDVLEVRDDTLTLGAGLKQGARPGLEVEMFRPGREIRHPRTGDEMTFVVKVPEKFPVKESDLKG